MTDLFSDPRLALSEVALKQLDLLDSPSEPDYNDIVAMAAELCGVPVALVTFLESRRQWFKAKIGTELSETDIGSAICRFTLIEDDVLVIPDTTRDKRTADNPIVTGEPFVRFYAGIPLRTVTGVAVGTLCLLDFQPNSLLPAQLRLLKRLARQVEVQLHLRALLMQSRELERRETELRLEMDHRIKNSLQLVAALLQLQMRELDEDAPARAILSEARSRLRSIASVHDALNLSDRPEAIELETFCRSLMTQIAETAHDGLEVHVEGLRRNGIEVRIAGRWLASIGIILNEFMTNSIKHAFPDGRAGRICVHLEQTDEACLLVMEDDGIGGGGATGSGGLGSRIMAAAASQLDTEIQWRPQEHGTSLAIDISGAIVGAPSVAMTDRKIGAA